jgi:hypothetical protein
MRLLIAARPFMQDPPKNTVATGPPSGRVRLGITAHLVTPVYPRDDTGGCGELHCRARCGDHHQPGRGNSRRIKHFRRDTDRPAPASKPLNDRRQPRPSAPSRCSRQSTYSSRPCVRAPPPTLPPTRPGTEAPPRRSRTRQPRIHRPHRRPRAPRRPGWRRISSASCVPEMN